MLEHQTATDCSGSVSMSRPNGVALWSISVGTSDVNHHDGFGAELHQIQHLGLGGQIPDALLHEHGIGTVQHHELGRMEGQPEIELARLPPDRRNSPALSRSSVKLGHVGMCDVGRQIGRHPVHVDPVPMEVVEDLARDF